MFNGKQAKTSFETFLMFSLTLGLCATYETFFSGVD